VKTRLECLPCLARQALESARIATDDSEVQGRIVRTVLSKLSQAELDATPFELLDATPFELGGMVQRTVRTLTGIGDPYLSIKQQSNRYALQKYPEMKELVASAEAPLAVATKIAITGNIIDFGVPDRLDIEEPLNRIMHTPFAVDDFDLFAERIAAADRILYLGDNAGEIVFDRVLIEEFSASEVIVTVKDEPFINDAMMADAQAAGLDESVRILPIPIYPETTDEFEMAWSTADLIIAKGQANYEAYSEVSGPLFYLLVAKCKAVADELGVSIGDLILKANSSSL